MDSVTTKIVLRHSVKTKNMKQNRRSWLLKTVFAVAGIGLSKIKTFAATDVSNKLTLKPHNMKLGAFSVSLNVKDLNASKTFYENLGFTVFAGDLKMNYLIMKNNNALIGLFQGMFQNNILTFNPGWDENAQKVDNFDDVRTIQKQLKSKGVKLMSEADETTTGPASMIFVDPDGNQIYIDQHV